MRPPTYFLSETSQRLQQWFRILIAARAGVSNEFCGSGAEAMPIFIDIVARAQSSTRTQAHGRGQAFRQFTNRVQCDLHRDDIAVRPKARDYSCNRGREL